MNIPNPNVDQDIVEELVGDMLAGVGGHVGEFNSSELSSACFTITLRVIQTVLEQNPACRPLVRQAVGTLLLACTDTGRPN